MMDASLRSVNRLQQKIAELKASDSERLSREYSDLVRGLTEQGVLFASTLPPPPPPATTTTTAATSSHTNSSSSSSTNRQSQQPPTDTVFANPVLSNDILQEAVPGILYSVYI